MPEQRNGEKSKTDAGWLLKAAVLLIVFFASIYVVLMGSFGYRLNRREDANLLRLDITSVKTTHQEISSYSGIRWIYDIPVVDWLAERDDLGIWLVHAYADVYINGEQVYACREPKADHIGHSPGCYWIFVPLDDTDIGKTVRIIVTPAYREVADRDPLIYSGRRDVIVGKMLIDEAAIVSVAILCIIGGIIFMILSTSMIRETKEQGIVFYLGLMLLLLGLWKLTDTPSVYAMMLPFDGLLTYGSLIFLMLMIPVLSAYLSHLQPEEKVYGWANKVYLLLDALMLLLQLADVRDLRENLLPMQIGILLFVVVMLEKNIYRLRKHDGFWHKWAFIVIGFSAIGDLMMYMYGFNSFQMGIMLTTILMYGILNGVMLLVRASKRREEMQQKDMQLRESHMRLMMSQIRPHFIYNTLNAIYVLCAKDPERARKAIYDFSKYLRSNFEQMDRSGPVAFKDELQHVRFYLSIEKLRFPDALNVEYDIKEQDFSLPALSLQPLVENAVRHGIRSKQGSGKIRVSSFAENREIYVVVEDDGEGFDVAAWKKNLIENDGEGKDGRRHVGLANVQDRIQEYGGRLLIESRPGKGTQMIICIPYEKVSENSGG